MHLVSSQVRPHQIYSPTDALMHPAPGPAKNLIEVGENKLSVAHMQPGSGDSAVAIAATALFLQDLQDYPPNGVGVILVFHTESGTYLFAGLRDNPELAGLEIAEGQPYPPQLNSTIGGYLSDFDKPLKDGIAEAVNFKLCSQTPPPAGSQKEIAQRRMESLRNTIGNNEGWEDKVCIHTNPEDKMCFLTAVKHMACSDAELAQLAQAANTVLQFRAASQIRLSLNAVRFVALQSVIDSSLESFRMDEAEKAGFLHQKFGNTVAVNVNDQAVAAVAALAAANAFQSSDYARLDG